MPGSASSCSAVAELMSIRSAAGTAFAAFAGGGTAAFASRAFFGGVFAPVALTRGCRAPGFRWSGFPSKGGIGQAGQKRTHNGRGPERPKLFDRPTANEKRRTRATRRAYRQVRDRDPVR